MDTKTKLISRPGNFADGQYARNIEERQAAVQDYFTEKQNKFNAMVKQADETAKKRIQVRQRATNRERKKQGNSVSDITGLQDRLWRAGYYGDIPYKKAVDGIIGRMTRQAMAAAQEDAKNNQKDTEKYDKFTNFISNLFSYSYPTSTNRNEQAISDHKVNSGVTEPYWVLNRKTHTLKHKQGDKTLKSFSVMTGLNNEQDGYASYYSWNPKSGTSYYDNTQHLRSTPAGIFILGNYTYDGKPAWRFQEAERGNHNHIQKLKIAMHAMPKSRIQSFNNGVRDQSFGCVNLTDDVLQYMVQNNATNDTLYSLPVREGNYIYESDGKGHPLKIEFGNAPSRVQGKNYDKPYDLEVYYNRGY